MKKTFITLIENQLVYTLPENCNVKQIYFYSHLHRLDRQPVYRFLEFKQLTENAIELKALPNTCEIIIEYQI